MTLSARPWPLCPEAPPGEMLWRVDTPSALPSPDSHHPSTFTGQAPGRLFRMEGGAGQDRRAASPHSGEGFPGPACLRGGPGHPELPRAMAPPCSWRFWASTLRCGCLTPWPQTFSSQRTPFSWQPGCEASLAQRPSGLGSPSAPCVCQLSGSGGRSG